MDNRNISHEEPNGFFYGIEGIRQEKPTGFSVGSSWEPTNNLIHSHSQKLPTSPSQGEGFHVAVVSTTGEREPGSDDEAPVAGLGALALGFGGVEIRQIPGVVGYFVSANGDVFTNRPRGKATIGRLKPLKTHLNGDGYLQFSARHNGKAKIVRVNRAVALAWVGPAPEGAFCCHRNGIRDDNYFENLRWDTQVGNEADKALHGSKLSGETHPQAKLTAQDVARIREAKRSNGRFWGAKEIAKELGVSLAAVKAIASGRNWSEVA